MARYYSDPHIKAILNLNVDKTGDWKEYTQYKAPHKPFLLLSVMDGIEQGWIQDNRIVLSQELVENFFNYWKSIMGNERKTSIALPFFYLQSAPFWELVYKEDMTPFKNCPSLGGLRKRVAYAKMDPELFQKMADPKHRDEIRSLIAEHYFAGFAREKIEQARQLNVSAYEYSEELLSMVADPFVKDHFGKGKTKEKTIYQQVRDQGFSKALRKQYNSSCAICRNKVVLPEGPSMVQGAHILPWHEYQNDDPRNGLSLCPSHHWLFDQHLITVKTDYTIEASRYLSKRDNRVDQIRNWDQQPILYPADPQFKPSEEALKIHYERFREQQKLLP